VIFINKSVNLIRQAEFLDEPHIIAEVANTHIYIIHSLCFCLNDLFSWVRWGWSPNVNLEILCDGTFYRLDGLPGIQPTALMDKYDFSPRRNFTAVEIPQIISSHLPCCVPTCASFFWIVSAHKGMPGSKCTSLHFVSLHCVTEW